MTRMYRASWVLPIAGPPIRDGWVEVRDGRVAALGGASERPQIAAADVPNVAIVPALVNAHVHLELSWMRGLVPPGDSMPAWVRVLNRGWCNLLSSERKCVPHGRPRVAAQSILEPEYASTIAGALDLRVGPHPFRIDFDETIGWRPRETLQA